MSNRKRHDGSFVEHLTLAHRDLKARNTLADPRQVMPRGDGDAAIEAGRLRATLPKLSWNVIRLSPAKQAAFS